MKAITHTLKHKPQKHDIFEALCLTCATRQKHDPWVASAAFTDVTDERVTIGDTVTLKGSDAITILHWKNCSNFPFPDKDTSKGCNLF